MVTRCVPSSERHRIRDETAAPPLVTVIIATYNWSSVLPFSVASALGQTIRDLEVLVVVDLEVR